MDHIDGDPSELFEALIPLFLSSKQGYALFDETDRLRFGNPVFREIMGVQEGAFPTWAEIMREGYQKSVGTKVESEDFETWLRSAQSRRGKLPFRTIESEMLDGRWIFTAETTYPGGWMLCVMTDISELGSNRRALRQELDHAVKSAFSDDLTGLSNRRYLMDRLKAKFAATASPSVSIAIIDIDYFKSVNDKYGHGFGDKVLKHFGATLQDAVGRDDLIGRMGGEEFLIATDSSDPSVLKTILQKAYCALESRGTFGERPDFAYSFSAGIACARPGESVSDTLKRADMALYQAKSEGRGRAIIWDDIV